MLGTALLPLLAGYDVVPIDRRDGLELEDGPGLRAAIDGCAAIVHLAALHPLVAPAGADYDRANVAPFRALLRAAREAGVGRLVLASSTSVWRDAPPGAPARFVDESTPADADDGYARSKRACEALLAASGIRGVALRLARFAGDSAEDQVRLLYRAVRPADAARAVALALDHPAPSALYAISAPTPFRPEDAALLSRDPRSAIRLRTGRDPVWAPERIGSVIVSERARAELGWAVAG